jgi:transposase-like protein
VETINLCSLAKHFSNEDSAYKLVESMRWANGPVCPHCGDEGRAYFLKARNGHRKTSTGRDSYRRLWKCAACRRQFSVLVGTIFEGSKVPLSKWLLAIYLMNASKNGVAAYELHRTLGVTNKTAWFMLHRIREAMKAGPVADMLRGTIVADETFIGGKLGNKHRQGKTPGRVGQRGQANAKGKIPVLSLINEQTGEVRSRIIPDVTGATLSKAIREQVDVAGSILHTDAGQQYRQLGKEFVDHQFVDHSDYEYVRYEADGSFIGTNPAEGYFSQLKRSIDGTQHHVSVEHLPRYLAEHDFRYSSRKLSDTARMAKLMSQTGGRRLTYKRVKLSSPA